MYVPICLHMSGLAWDSVSKVLACEVFSCTIYVYIYYVCVCVCVCVRACVCVTRCAKRGLIHASDFATLMSHNFVCNKLLH